MNLGVLVSGRGSNLQAILDAVRERRLRSRVAVVISDNPDAPALDRARSLGIPAVYVNPGTSRPRLVPASAGRVVDALTEHRVDLVLLAGFMRVIGPTLFRAYPGRILNIHPSLLPAFRGLEAQRQALEAGVKTAGCTVHFVVPAIDAGPIVLQAAVPVLPDDTVETLSARILVEEHRIYVEAIRLIEAGEVPIGDPPAPVSMVDHDDEGACR